MLLGDGSKAQERGCSRKLGKQSKQQEKKKKSKQEHLIYLIENPKMVWTEDSEDRAGEVNVKDQVMRSLGLTLEDGFSKYLFSKGNKKTPPESRTPLSV